MIILLSMRDNPVEKELIDQIYQMYGAGINRSVKRILGYSFELVGEDIIHEGILDLSEFHMDKLKALEDNPDALVAYIIQVIKNRAIKWASSQKNKDGEYREISLDDESITIRLYDEKTEPERVFYNKETVQKAAEYIVYELSEKERALIRGVAEDVPYEQLAEQLHYKNAASARSATDKVRNKIQHAVSV